MQISAIVELDAEGNITPMILTPFNCSAPFLWGKEIQFVNNGKILEDNTRIQIPGEFDFFNMWCGQDPQNAKTYYERMYLF